MADRYIANTGQARTAAHYLDSLGEVRLARTVHSVCRSYDALSRANKQLHEENTKLRRQIAGCPSDGDATTLQAQCPSDQCGHIWIVAYLPMNINLVSQLASRATCPRCGNDHPVMAHG